MSFDTLNITLEMAEVMMPCVHERIKILNEDVRKIEDELRGLVALRAAIQAALQNRTVSVQPTTKGQPRKRLAKGAGEVLIYNLLKSLPEGVGMSIGEVMSKTGVNRATVHRTFHDAKRNKGRFTQGKDDLWRLTK